MRTCSILLVSFAIACSGDSEPYGPLPIGPSDSRNAGDPIVGGDLAGGDAVAGDEQSPGDPLVVQDPPTRFDSVRDQWWVPAASAVISEGFRSAEASSPSNRFWSLTDINGDQRPDLIHTADPTQGSISYGEVWGISDQPYWKVYLNNGTSFETDATRWYVPDSGTWGGFFAAEYFVIGSYRFWSLRDIDGDGYADLVQTADGSYANAVWGESDAPYWRVFFNDGSAFSMTPVDWPVPDNERSGGFFWFNVNGSYSNWFARDMNGDGRIDLVHSGDTAASAAVWGESDAPYWKVYLNTGSGFDLTATSWPVPVLEVSGGFYLDERTSATAHWGLVDVTGDGRPDLAHTGDTNASYEVWGLADVPYWKVHVNTGAGFDPIDLEWPVPVSGDTNGYFSVGYDSNNQYWQLMDLDRDGLVDLVSTCDTSMSQSVWGESDQPYWQVFFNSGAGFDTSPFDWFVPESGRSGGYFSWERAASYERWWVADLDGDGLLELVQTADTSNDRVWGISDVPYWRVFDSIP